MDMSLLDNLACSASTKTEASVEDSVQGATVEDVRG